MSRIWARLPGEAALRRIPGLLTGWFFSPTHRRFPSSYRFPIGGDPIGNEPVYDGDRLVGITTGGAYGHTAKQTLAFAYVEPPYAAPETGLRVLILGEPRPARVLSEPVYDPDHQRLRS